VLYLVDGGVRCAHGDEFECASDAEAINTALDRAGGRALELWDGERKVLSAAANTSRARRAACLPPTQTGRSPS
jgi:hypothetical protein